MRLIILYVVRSKSLKLGGLRQSHSREADKHSQKKWNQSEMVESEDIQAIVNQVAVKAVTAVMVALRDTDAGPRTATNTASLRELPRQRHGTPALEKPSFNWNTHDRYIELLNFEKEVMNILEAKHMKLIKKKTPVITNWLGREGL